MLPGRSSFSSERVNLFSSSSLPIALAACVICRNSSCKRRKARMMDPSKTSVNLQISANLAPLHHCKTASISSTLKLETYSSSFSVSLDSIDTLAMRRALSCIARRGVAKSSLSRICCDDCVKIESAWMIPLPLRQTHLLIKNKTAQQGRTLLFAQVIEDTVEYHLGKKQFIARTDLTRHSALLLDNIVT
jgi:hypothetical protein